MIIVRINGGLGNQLFQYAAACSLASKNNDILKIDVLGYQPSRNQKQIYRNLDITDFSISAAIATSEEVNKIKNRWGFLSKVLRLFRQKILKLYYVDWHPEILDQAGNIYLDGYFQSEKYFLGRVDQILGEFTLKPDLCNEIEPIVQLIQSKPISVSLHIRRGDYVENPKTMQYHLVCDIEYYERAIAYMQQKYSNLHLFIFSDDPDWVKKNLSVTHATFISSDKGAENSLKPSQELVLMSKCDHHILSNSSFSWWGAYLNQSTCKTVLVPDIWNNGYISQLNIAPESWLRFPVLKDA